MGAGRTFGALLIALAAAVAACGPSRPGRTPLPPGGVDLLTSDGIGVGCPANVVEGPLVLHDTAGTAVIEDGVAKPVRWPYGYAGRRIGAEIEVLDEAGAVVARTGTVLRLGGGETMPGVWLACPDPVTIR